MACHTGNLRRTWEKNPRFLNPGVVPPSPSSLLYFYILPQTNETEKVTILFERQNHFLANRTDTYQRGLQKFLQRNYFILNFWLPWEKKKSLSWGICSLSREQSHPWFVYETRKRHNGSRLHWIKDIHTFISLLSPHCFYDAIVNYGLSLSFPTPLPYL